MESGYPVKDGIEHLAGCSRPGRYHRYDERAGHCLVLVVKGCTECRKSVVLWSDTPFGIRLTTNQRRRLEHDILRRFYTPEELEEKRRARTEWVDSGRRGHAPGCTRTHKELVALETTELSVPYATREITSVGCTGCSGKFDPVVTY